MHRKLLTGKPEIPALSTGPSPGAAGLVAPGPIATENQKPVQDEAVLFRGAGLWLGAMVPKRWAKRAVTRNAIKRQIYDVSQNFFPKQLPAAFVVRLRRDFSRKEYLSASSAKLKQDVRTELLALMQVGARPS